MQSWRTASGPRSSRRGGRGRRGRSLVARSSKHRVQETQREEDLQARLLAMLALLRLRKASFTPLHGTRLCGFLTATRPPAAQVQSARGPTVRGGRVAGSTAATRRCAVTLQGWWRSLRPCCRARACGCCRRSTWWPRPGTAAWQTAAGLAVAPGEGLAPPGGHRPSAAPLSSGGWRPAHNLQQLMRRGQRIEPGWTAHSRSLRRSRRAVCSPRVLAPLPHRLLLGRLQQHLGRWRRRPGVRRCLSQGGRQLPARPPRQPYLPPRGQEWAPQGAKSPHPLMSPTRTRLILT